MRMHWSEHALQRLHERHGDGFHQDDLNEVAFAIVDHLEAGDDMVSPKVEHICAVVDVPNRDEGRPVKMKLIWDIESRRILTTLPLRLDRHLGIPIIRVWCEDRVMESPSPF